MSFIWLFRLLIESDCVVLVTLSMLLPVNHSTLQRRHSMFLPFQPFFLKPPHTSSTELLVMSFLLCISLARLVEQVNTNALRVCRKCTEYYFHNRFNKHPDISTITATSSPGCSRDLFRFCFSCFFFLFES